MQIPTSPPLVGHNPRRNIALSLNGAPPIETGFPLRSELTNLQIGRAPFSPRRFMSISFLRLYTDIHRAGLAKAGWRCGDGQKKRNVSLNEFQGGGMQLNLL